MAGEHPGPGDDDGRDDGPVDGRPAPPRTFLQRMSQTFLNPPKPKAKPKAAAEQEPERELTDAEKRARVTQIDDLERRLGYAASILASVISLITFIPFINDPAMTIQKTASPVKGHTCPTHYQYTKLNGHFTCVAHVSYPRSHWVTELAVLLVFALAIFITTRIRRRAALAFTTFMTGVAMLSVVQSVLAFPFIFLGGWLLIRAWRVQRYGSPTAKGPNRSGTGGGTGGTRGSGTKPGAKPGARPGAKPAAPRGNGRAGRGRRGATNKPTGPARPTANKRYTPKAPPRRRIPPPE